MCLATDALLAVFGKDLGTHMDLAVIDACHRRDGRMAASAELASKRPLRFHLAPRLRVIEQLEKCRRVSIVFAALDSERALAGGRKHDLEGDRNADVVMSEPVEAGGRQDRRIHLTSFQLLQPSVDVAPQRDDLQVRPGGKQLRGPARGRSADHGALLQRLNGLGPDQLVLDVRARADRSETDFLRPNDFNILHRMHGEIDVAIQQCGIQFLGPQTLAANLRERPVGNTIAAGGDGNDFDVTGGPALRDFQRGGDLARLDQRQRRTACAKFRIAHLRSTSASSAIQAKEQRMALILGLESSCDDTAAALVTGDRTILAQAVVSQNDAHRPFGGVVPEIAARAHVQILPGLVQQVLGEAKVAISDVDAVAATAGPGLIGGVMVALLVAKGLALSAGKPLIAVNHLEGHALSPRLADPDLEFPYLLLLVSGGHCQILEVLGVGEYRRLATTIDDAAGEAFDKAAKLLGLGYPGGPAVEQLAKEGNPEAVPLPRPLVGSGEPHFSFAGLKAAVQRAVASGEYRPADIAASFQQAVIDCLVDRTRLALSRTDAPSLVVAGGVAANRAIRSSLEELAKETGRCFSVPPVWLCTDNAAMIAWAGSERYSAGMIDHLGAPARARWPLDPDAEKVRGAGVKA